MMISEIRRKNKRVEEGRVREKDSKKVIGKVRLL